MKHFFILLPSLCLTFFCEAQVKDSIWLQLIATRIRNLQPTRTIYYADKPVMSKAFYTYNHFTESFSNLEIRGLYFTKIEKQYVISEMKKAFSAQQQEDLFPDSKRMPSTKLVRFVEDLVYPKIDSITDSSGIAQFNLYKRTWAFSFTGPVYLRNNSILIYYFMHYRHSMGEEGIEVYKKENNNWERVGTLSGTAW